MKSGPSLSPASPVAFSEQIPSVSHSVPGVYPDSCLCSFDCSTPTTPRLLHRRHFCLLAYNLCVFYTLLALSPTLSAAVMCQLCCGCRGKQFCFVGMHHRQSMLMAGLTVGIDKFSHQSTSIAVTFNMPTLYQQWVREREAHIDWSMVTCQGSTHSELP